MKPKKGYQENDWKQFLPPDKIAKNYEKWIIKMGSQKNWHHLKGS